MTEDSYRPPTGSRPAVELDEGTRDDLFSVMSDPSCRAILEELSDRDRTVAELARALDLPLSTAYRKVDRLSQTPLVQQTYRVESTGNHAQQFHRVVDRIHLKLSETEDGFLTASLQYAEEASRP